MLVKIKKLCNSAVIPSYAHPADAGMDLVATSRMFDKYGNVSYGTGIAVEIPEGHVGLIFPRSSISKKSLSLCNSVGCVDSNYRGEIMVKCKPTAAFMDFSDEDSNSYTYDIVGLLGENRKDAPDAELYDIGDRIAQLIIMPYPHIDFIEVEDLSDSDRGVNGFGSSGK